jgi:hypothetical protein
MEKLKTFVVTNQVVIIIVVSLSVLALGFKVFKDGKK